LLLPPELPYWGAAKPGLITAAITKIIFILKVFADEYL